MIGMFFGIEKEKKKKKEKKRKKEKVTHGKDISISNK